MRGWLAFILGSFLIGAAGCDDRSASTATGSAGAPERVTVFAAASTTEPLTAAARDFESRQRVRVECSFEASTTLARQIKAGAKADVFISADEAWMDELDKAGEIQPGTRVDLLGNDLVVIAPADSASAALNAGASDASGFLTSVERLAVGDPEHVPAGKYAREALRSLGLWERLSSRLVPGANVRAALRLVEIGEADAGIVYATDAKSSPRVRVVAVLPQGSHGPVRYPAALCRGASKSAEAFFAFLRSKEGSRAFEDAGFRVLTVEQGARDDHR